MVAQILTIIGSLLVIVIGLWKFYSSKRAIRQKKEQDAQNQVDKGLQDKDPSEISGGFDRANRL